ncbi:MAG: TonB-dependent receptor [Acidobacteria bacterium]|nr:TonB-dependent receptor [Acidobacteriota bacterium]
MHRLITRSTVAALAALLAFACAPFSARGQDSATTATLTGSVRDAASAAVPAAVVTLRDLTTNQTRRVVADTDGGYRAAALPVGDYEVHVEAEGFAPYVNPSMTLALGRTTTLDVTLRPAGVSTEVTVTDQPPALDTTSVSSTTSIDPERIEELPVNSRNYLEFTLLAPGVAPSSRQTSSGGVGATQAGPLADSGFTFGGLRPRSNTISIDGLDNTDETTGAARVALSPEIVREFQVVNNGLSAEFGGAAGGAINVVTKTGSNEWHGDLFSFVQNERFNAREPFADPPPASRLRFRRFQPGGALGGPLKRDRLFFYAAAEQEHLSAEDESEINRTVRTRINSLLASGFAPAVSVRSLTRGRFRTGADETEAALKLTYVAGSKHTLNFRFAFTDARDRGDAFNTDVLSDPSARGSAYTKDYQLTGSAVSVLSPSAVNDLRFQASTRRAVTHAGDTAGPGIEIAGVARFGRPYDAEGVRRETREQFVDNVTLSRPRGEWKAGATVNHVSLDDDARDGFGGLYVFRSVGDFAAGRPALWRQSFGESRTGFGVTSFGGFLQNQWRAAPELTLNLGARYDVERLPRPFRTDTNNFSPRLGLAWSPSNEWVVRAGVGLYYDRLPLAFLNRATQKDGVRAFEQVALEGQAAAVFAATGGGRALAPFAGIAPSVFRADPSFVTPYSGQANVGVERLLTQDVTVRADYLFTRGVHLPRTRNVNLLPPVVPTQSNAAALGVTSPTPQQLGRPVFGPGRVDPRFDAVYQLEDSSGSTYHGLTLALNKRLSDEFELLASYTLSKATDDASDFDEQPANPYDLRAERALSRQDVRQRFVLSSLFDLPFGEEEEGAGKGEEGGDLLGEILGHIEIAPIVTFSSGRPVNPLTGADEERGLAFPLASRPLGLARNSLRTRSYVNVDLRALKYIPVGERRRLDLVVEFFNLFNRPNVVGVNPVFGAGAAPLPSFGAPAAFAAPRQVRFSIDFEF